MLARSSKMYIFLVFVLALMIILFNFFIQLDREFVENHLDLIMLKSVAENLKDSSTKKKTVNIEMILTHEDGDGICHTSNKGGVSIKYYCDSFNAWWWKKAFLKWEDETFQFLDLLVDEPCLVSIGEWIGPVVLYYGLKYPNKPIYIYEPNPISYHTLISNLNLNQIKNSHVFLNAVTGENKGYQFYNMWSSGGSLKDEHDHPAMGKSPRWYANGISFMDYVWSSPERQSCAYKIDVEGAEQDLIPQLLENGIFSKMSSLSLSPHQQFWEEEGTASSSSSSMKENFRKILESFKYMLGKENLLVRITEEEISRIEENFDNRSIPDLFFFE